MKTQRTTRAALHALAAAGLALTNFGAAVYAAPQPDQRVVTALNGWSGKTGPGMGSVKTPFNIVESARPTSVFLGDTFEFHTVDGLAAQQPPSAVQGPGAGSVKAPGVR